MRHVFEMQVRIAASAERVFAWHEEPGALQKLIPPGEPVRVVEHTGGIHDGARVVLRIGYFPFSVRWVAVHEGYIEGRQFKDRQHSGPMRFWLHTHTFEPDGEGACILRDHVEFQLPLSPVADLALPLVLRKLEKTFSYRHRLTAAALS
ncbi:MAG: SRPBCC family protein [Acidobacteriota bacterium]|nr:SRPBCC family protein [Acidobacteriota bacterium]